MRTLLLDARSLSGHEKAVTQAANLLKSGELVAFPTETVYGLGADAFNAEAIARVFAAKGRPPDNPLIVHLADAAQMELCGHPDARARLLAEVFMPGPLTLVIPANDAVPEIARAGLPTVALRAPDHPVALALLRRSGPLVAPSANVSGRPSPTEARHVLHDLEGRIAAVLDGGTCRVGIESTVLDLSGPRAIVLRPGAVTAGDIEAVLGEPVLPFAEASDAPKAPGMKYRHYAPEASVRLITEGKPPLLPAGENRLVLTLPEYLDRFPGIDTRLLSESTFYAELRSADERGVKEILVYVGTEGPARLGAGLWNRLCKAAA